MKYVAGPDVSLDETAVCIVEACGEIVREFRVAGEPEALITALRKLAVILHRMRRDGTAFRFGKRPNPAAA